MVTLHQKCKYSKFGIEHHKRGPLVFLEYVLPHSINNKASGGWKGLDKEYNTNREISSLYCLLLHELRDSRFIYAAGVHAIICVTLHYASLKIQ